MKRLGLIAILGMLAGVSGCKSVTEIDVPEDNVLKEEVIIKATHELDPRTKTVLKENGEVWWKPGDAIGVFIGPRCYPFYSCNMEDAPSAYFAGEVVIVQGDEENSDSSYGAYTYWGVFPPELTNNYTQDKNYDYSLGNEDYETPTREGESVTVYLPARQKGVPGTFDSNNFISIAKSNDYRKLSFYNLCGGLAFCVEQEGIHTVAFSGNAGETLAGKVNVVMDSEGRPIVKEVRDGKTRVTLSMSDGECFVPGEWYYIVMLPAVLSEGYTMKFYADEGVKTIISNDPIEVKRSVFGRLTKPDTQIDDYESKERLVWIDAAANFKDYANDADRIASDMARIKETGFTGVIVEVRPTTAGLLFKSDVEPELDMVDAWAKGGYVWLRRTETFDYLQAFIDAGKANGLDVYAVINTMVGGEECPYGLGSNGPLYDGTISRDWASVINMVDGLKNCMDLGTGTKFLNPANDDVVTYLLGILEDLASYDVKGIILDRCRYDDYELMSDFSDISRQKFEEHIGYQLENWPDDVFLPGVNQLQADGTELQKKWMEFRAKVIHDFMEKASERVHSVNPDIRFGGYVGAWYSSYYYSGVNWASPKYETSSYYKWATADYNEYGYADHCDIMIIGAYASTSSIYGSGEWTMQGFCKKAQTLFAGDVPFVGGADIGNSTGFANGGQGGLMPSIVDACINASTGGMFFFDLCHIKMYDYWDDIKIAFDQYLSTL
jgi:hypothetical protein